MQRHRVSSRRTARRKVHSLASGKPGLTNSAPSDAGRSDRLQRHPSPGNDRGPVTPVLEVVVAVRDLGQRFED